MTDLGLAVGPMAHTRAQVLGFGLALVLALGLRLRIVSVSALVGGVTWQLLEAAMVALGAHEGLWVNQ